MRYGKYFETKAGRLYIEEEDGFLVRLGSAGGASGPEESLLGEGEAGDGVILQETPLLRRTKEEVLAYLAGERTCFDIPLRLYGTDFQKRIWDVLRQIPYGEARTYGQTAAMAGSPKGARAAGQACNRNPVMIIVPCHRVIGGNGRLAGFGGGLPMKKALLELEKIAYKE